MSNTRKLAYLLIVFVIGVIAAWILHDTPPVITKDSNIDTLFITEDNGLRYYLGAVADLNYIYRSSSPPTLSETAAEHNFDIAINGGYFLGEYTQAQHAGLLYLDEEIVKPFTNSDDQISAVVSYHKGGLNITHNDDYTEAQLKDVRFAVQAGPILISNSEIQTDAIDISSNGALEYKRSFIGTIDSEVLIGITTENVTLTTLANRLKNEFPSSDVNVINLDGGASTAFFVSTNPRYNHNSKWYLPNVIGLCIERSCK